MKFSLPTWCVAALVLPAFAPAVFAESLQGTFLTDTDVQLFQFTVTGTTSVVTIQSWSYGGGTDANGDTISAGGFAPALSVFQGAYTDPTSIDLNAALFCGPGANFNSATGNCSDVYYPTSNAFPGGYWAPGTYTVALTEQGNQANGPTLGDGFAQTGPGNFTCQLTPAGNQNPPPGSPAPFPLEGAFCDQSPGFEDTGYWQLDITGAATVSAIAPEPNTLFLVLPCVLALALRRGRPRPS